MTLNFKILTVSDLDFGTPSIGTRKNLKNFVNQLDELNNPAVDLKICVLNGNIFNFQNGSNPHRMAESSGQFIKTLLKNYPNVTFRYVLGKDDAVAEFYTELRELSLNKKNIGRFAVEKDYFLFDDKVLIAPGDLPKGNAEVLKYFSKEMYLKEKVEVLLKRDLPLPKIDEIKNEKVIDLLKSDTQINELKNILSNKREISNVTHIILGNARDIKEANVSDYLAASDINLNIIGRGKDNTFANVIEGHVEDNKLLITKQNNVSFNYGAKASGKVYDKLSKNLDDMLSFPALQKLPDAVVTLLIESLPSQLNKLVNSK